MARKKYRYRYSASVATTLHLVKSANEKRVPKEDRVDRVVVADSWFASVSTAEALWDEFAIKFIGNVKTATRKFPVEDMRWMLHQGERGDICVYTTDSGDLFGVGWHDHYYKTFVANAGSTQWATPAKKKRQRDDGSNYYREVPRPEVCEIYYSANGKIDQHNRTRQYLLRLEKIWATKRWNSRFMYTVLCGMTCVDTFLTCASLVPDRHGETDGSFASFLSCLVDQIMPPENTMVELTPQSSASVSLSESDTPGGECELEKIGMVVIKDGAGKGRNRPKDARCAMCLQGDRKTKGRAPKTIWRCKRCKVPLCSTHKSNCLGEHIEQQKKYY